MSATVDCNLFSKYFSILVNGKQEGAPVIRVDGKLFDVAEYYFEDISGLSEVKWWRAVLREKNQLNLNLVFYVNV